MQKSILSCFLFLTLHTGIGQHVDVVNLKNGLSNNYVQCVLQDQQGYIWIGTRDGLNVFDGRQIETFRVELSSSFIYSLMQHSSGDIWIGNSQGGIDIYHPKLETFETLNTKPGFQSLVNTDVYELYEDLHHNVWIGSLQGLGLVPYDKDTLLWYSSYENESLLSFTSICEGRDSSLWVGTRKGLNQVERSADNISISPIENSFFNDLFIRDIIQDSVGDLWIATDDKGIFLFDPIDKKIRHHSIVSQDKKESQVWKLLEDSRGNLWAAVINGGIYKFDMGAQKFVSVQDMISPYFKSQSITGFLEDYNGNLWVASHGDGVCYFNPQRYVFEKYLSGTDPEKRQGSLIVSSFLEDHTGEIWVGTDGEGIKKMNTSGEITNGYSTKNGLSSNVILDMIEDQSNGKWLATWQGGVNYIDAIGKHIQVYNDKSVMYGLQNPDVKSLLIDESSNMWMSTHGNGIAIYDLKKRQFVNPSRISKAFRPDFGQWGSDILQAKNGDIWIASHAGLVRYIGDSVQNYFAGSNAGMLSSSLIYCLFEDSNENIWVGTSSSLERFNPAQNTFENYSRLYQVPVNVKCILEDERHQLWISTIHEIVALDLNSNKVRHFDETFNVQEGQFHECSCMKSSTGKMYFGGTEGFNSFWPDSLKSDQLNSRLLITQLYLFNEKQIPGVPESVLLQAMPYCSKIELPYKMNVVSLEFLALNYLPKGKTWYAYKMEGFNEDWSPATVSTLATYTNLNPGEYVFRVRSLTASGEIQNETSVIVNIIPPFWQTTWFRVLVIFWAILFTVGYLLYRLYSSKQKRIELQKLVEERTKEVREKNLQLEQQASILEVQRDDLHRNNAILRDLVTIKNRLFSIIAHDLRNPFTSLLGFTKLLNTDYLRYTEEEKQKLIKNLHDSSSTIYSLLENLLAWSKSQQDDLIFEPEQIQLSTFIDSHFDLIREGADKKMVTLLLIAPEDVTFYADRNMLSIIIRNLLSNALKYSPVNGEIEVGYKLQNDDLELYVKDEGLGIEDPSQLFHVNEPAQKHRDHNHGLGLILCKEFVEKHGGEIWVKKNIDKGACFVFSLPESQVEVTVQSDLYPEKDNIQLHEDRKSELQERISGVPTVLIAEDADDIRWYIKQTLFPDFHVIEAVNGSDGITLALEKMPELIISDMNMPGINGLDFCQKIKSNPQTCHIPFILLTAERSTDKKVDGYQHGADDFITKPVDSAVLRARLFNIIESRKRLKVLYQGDITIDPRVFTTNVLDQEFIEKLNQTIVHRMTDVDLNPDTLAQEMMMSRTGLYMKIKALTGESVSIYVRNIRLKESCKLLKTKQMNISEVAFAVGFNQLPYYTSSFKDAFGMTPSEYMRG